MNKYVEIRDRLDKDAQKKIKLLLKEYKVHQDDIINSVSGVILPHIDENGVIIISPDVVFEIKSAVTTNLNGLTKKEQEFVSDLLAEAYRQAATETVKALGTITIAADWKILRDEFVNKAINAPIAGKNFSERIWNNTNDLANRIYNDVLECIQTGKRPNQIAVEIKRDFGSSAYEAKRLVNTELAKVVNDAQLEVYQNSNVVEKVMYTATLEENTCEDCGKLDGQYFDKYKAPSIPQHPNCRCCLIPVTDSWQPKRRADNTTKQNIDYTTFEEWQG